MTYKFSLSFLDPVKMHGARRVIIFCLLTAVLPTILLIIPLYLRHNLFADVIYSVAESDVLEIRDGISTIFCQVNFRIYLERPIKSTMITVHCNEFCVIKHVCA